MFSFFCAITKQAVELPVCFVSNSYSSCKVSEANQNKIDVSQSDWLDSFADAVGTNRNIHIYFYPSYALTKLVFPMSIFLRERFNIIFEQDGYSSSSKPVVFQYDLVDGAAQFPLASLTFVGNLDISFLPTTEVEHSFSIAKLIIPSTVTLSTSSTLKKFTCGSFSVPFEKLSLFPGLEAREEATFYVTKGDIISKLSNGKIEIIDGETSIAITVPKLNFEKMGTDASSISLEGTLEETLEGTLSTHPPSPQISITGIQRVNLNGTWPSDPQTPTYYTYFGTGTASTTTSTVSTTFDFDSTSTVFPFSITSASDVEITLHTPSGAFSFPGALTATKESAILILNAAATVSREFEVSIPLTTFKLSVRSTFIHTTIKTLNRSIATSNTFPLELYVDENGSSKVTVENYVPTPLPQLSSVQIYCGIKTTQSPEELKPYLEKTQVLFTTLRSVFNFTTSVTITINAKSDSVTNMIDGFTTTNNMLKGVSEDEETGKTKLIIYLTASPYGKGKYLCFKDDGSRYPPSCATVNGHSASEAVTVPKTDFPTIASLISPYLSETTIYIAADPKQTLDLSTLSNTGMSMYIKQRTSSFSLTIVFPTNPEVIDSLTLNDYYTTSAVTLPMREVYLESISSKSTGQFTFTHSESLLILGNVEYYLNYELAGEWGVKTLKITTEGKPSSGILLSFVNDGVGLSGKEERLIPYTAFEKLWIYRTAQNDQNLQYAPTITYSMTEEKQVNVLISGKNNMAFIFSSFDKVPDSFSVEIDHGEKKLILGYGSKETYDFLFPHIKGTGPIQKVPSFSPVRTVCIYTTNSADCGSGSASGSGVQQSVIEADPTYWTEESDEKFAKYNKITFQVTEALKIPYTFFSGRDVTIESQSKSPVPTAVIVTIDVADLGTFDIDNSFTTLTDTLNNPSCPFKIMLSAKPAGGAGLKYGELTLNGVVIDGSFDTVPIQVDDLRCDYKYLDDFTGGITITDNLILSGNDNGIDKSTTIIFNDLKENANDLQITLTSTTTITVGKETIMQTVSVDPLKTITYKIGSSKDVDALFTLTSSTSELTISYQDGDITNLPKIGILASSSAPTIIFDNTWATKDWTGAEKLITITQGSASSMTIGLGSQIPICFEDITKMKLRADGEDVGIIGSMRFIKSGGSTGDIQIMMQTSDELVEAGKRAKLTIESLIIANKGGSMNFDLIGFTTANLDVILKNLTTENTEKTEVSFYEILDAKSGSSLTIQKMDENTFLKNRLNLISLVTEHLSDEELPIINKETPFIIAPENKFPEESFRVGTKNQQFGHGFNSPYETRFCLKDVVKAATAGFNQLVFTKRVNPSEIPFYVWDKSPSGTFKPEIVVPTDVSISNLYEKIPSKIKELQFVVTQDFGANDLFDFSVMPAKDCNYRFIGSSSTKPTVQVTNIGSVNSISIEFNAVIVDFQDPPSPTTSERKGLAQKLMSADIKCQTLVVNDVEFKEEQEITITSANIENLTIDVDSLATFQNRKVIILPFTKPVTITSANSITFAKDGSWIVQEKFIKEDFTLKKTDYTNIEKFTSDANSIALSIGDKTMTTVQTTRLVIVPDPSKNEQTQTIQFGQGWNKITGSNFKIEAGQASNLQVQTASYPLPSGMIDVDVEPSLIVDPDTQDIDPIILADNYKVNTNITYDLTGIPDELASKRVVTGTTVTFEGDSSIKFKDSVGKLTVDTANLKAGSNVTFDNMEFNSLNAEPTALSTGTLIFKATSQVNLHWHFNEFTDLHFTSKNDLLPQVTIVFDNDPKDPIDVDEYNSELYRVENPIFTGAFDCETVRHMAKFTTTETGETKYFGDQNEYLKLQCKPLGDEQQLTMTLSKLLPAPSPSGTSEVTSSEASSESTSQAPQSSTTQAKKDNAMGTGAITGTVIGCVVVVGIVVGLLVYFVTRSKYSRLLDVRPMDTRGEAGVDSTPEKYNDVTV